MEEAGPATETLAAHTTEIADLIVQVGATTEQLRKFPSIAGTDTSGRSVVADANEVAGAWNDVALAPDATLFALNRLMPPFVKSTPSNAISVRVSIDRLVLGSIPDIGFTGDPGLHGPKRYNWHQLVGSIKYTLLRLQERDRREGARRAAGPGDTQPEPNPDSWWWHRRPTRRGATVGPCTTRRTTHPVRQPPEDAMTLRRRRVVDLVRAARRRKAWLSAAALILTLVMASGYLFLGALRVNPLRVELPGTVELPESAGLLPNQDVTLRGVPIGRVERLDITPAGVNAVVNVKSSVPIPVSSDVRVSGLSPAGEQYIDFVAESDAGPYLSDGSVVEQRQGDRARQPGGFACRRGWGAGPGGHRENRAHQARVSLSEAGPQKLADIIDGGTFLLSTLDSVLPETTSMLRTSRIVLTTGRRQERRNRTSRQTI